MLFLVSIAFIAKLHKTTLQFSVGTLHKDMCIVIMAVDANKRQKSGPAPTYPSRFWSKREICGCLPLDILKIYVYLRLVMIYFVIFRVSTAYNTLEINTYQENNLWD